MISYNIDELYSAKADEKYVNCRLFHYTSIDTLKSIIDNATIRFTDCAFLNDIDEYIYIKEVIESAEFNGPREMVNFIKSMTKNLYDDNKDYVFYHNKICGKVIGCHYYVFCGSDNDDMLAMWKYYTQNSNYIGCALEVDITRLADMTEEVFGNIYFGHVIYDRNKQIEIIEKYAKELYEEYQRRLTDSPEDICIDDMQEHFYEFLQRIRIFFKKEEFSGEKEIRVVISIPKERLYDSDLISAWDIKGGIMRPQRELVFQGRLPIKSIRLSPSLKNGICVRGMRDYLDAKGYSDCEIYTSNMNLRF